MESFEKGLFGKDLVAFFSDAKTDIHVPLLCAKPLIPEERFSVTATQQFRYYGREAFKSLVEEYAKLSELGAKSLRLISNIGSGKSFVLAMLVCYLNLVRRRAMKEDDDEEKKQLTLEEQAKKQAKRRRVVYIPDCSRLLANPVPALRDALLLAFDDDTKAVEELKSSIREAEARNPDDTEKKLKAGWAAIEAFVEKQPDYSMVFVFDGWQGVLVEEADKPDVRQLKAERKLSILLPQLASRQFTIDAISAYSQHARDRKQAVFEKMYGGLNENEWKVWKDEKRIPEEYVSEQKREDDKTNEQEVREITGLVPLFLSHLRDTSKATLKEATPKYFEGDEKKKIPSRLGIRKHLVDFTNMIKKKHPEELEDYIKLMVDALAERQSQYAESYHLFPQRYMYSDKHIVRTISGLVWKLLAEVLRDLQRDLYFKYVCSSWVRDATSSTNVSVRSFAYEECKLKQIYSNPGVLDEAFDGKSVHIFHFSELPVPERLAEILKDMKEDLLLGWPTAWNHPLVDAVLAGRIEVEEKIEKIDKLKRKRQAWISVGKWYDYQIQVTTGTLEGHNKSLKVFDGWYAHWIPAGYDSKDQVHRLVWVTNRSQPKAQPPADARKSRNVLGTYAELQIVKVL